MSEKDLENSVAENADGDDEVAPAIDADVTDDVILSQGEINYNEQIDNIEDSQQNHVNGSSILVEPENVTEQTSEYVKLVVEENMEGETDGDNVLLHDGIASEYIEDVIINTAGGNVMEANEEQNSIALHATLKSDEAQEHDGVSNSQQAENDSMPNELNDALQKDNEYNEAVLKEKSFTSEYVEDVVGRAEEAEAEKISISAEYMGEVIAETADIKMAGENDEALGKEKSFTSEYVGEVVESAQEAELEKKSITSEYVGEVIGQSAYNSAVDDDTGTEMQSAQQGEDHTSVADKSITSAYVDKVLTDADDKSITSAYVQKVMTDAETLNNDSLTQMMSDTGRQKSHGSLSSEYVKSLIAESAILKQPTPPKGSKRVSSGKKLGDKFTDSEYVPEPPPPPAVPRAARSSEAVTPKAMQMAWSFGFNNNLPVLNISTELQSIVAYASGHTVVLYDYDNNTQSLLQGLANSITCMCVSEDTRWLAAADCGKNNMIIVWDTATRIPIRTIFDPHNEGVFAIAITNDAKYLATVSAGDPQIMAIWDWTTESDAPIATCTLQSSFGPQHYIYFNPEDCYQIVSNSETQVIFYLWKPGNVEFYAPPLTDDDFNRPVGKFSQSIFQSQCARALTATSVGNLVLWDINQPLTQINVKVSIANKKPLKLVKLQEKPITVLTTTDSYIVCGDSLGHIKFFDQTLMLIYWYQDFQLGPINSVSFAYYPHFAPKQINNELSRDATVPGIPFNVKDFVVSTYTAVIGRVIASEPDVKVIHRDHCDKVHALAAHPNRSLLAIGGYSGLVNLWNYGNKTVVASRWFDRGNMVQCCCFDPKGAFLAVGFTNGCIQILDSLSLNTQQTEPFQLSRSAITHIAFSFDSQYFATADADFTVSVFKRQLVSGAPYTHLGRYRPHFKRIVDLLFGIQLDSMMPRLLSLGEDRVLVEYDMENSHTDNLCLLGSDRIEQSAVPYCMTWYPSVTKESFILTTNDQYKFKLYNSTTKMCRKTVLGPTYGSPVERVAVLPNTDTNAERGHRYMAYASKDKVGLQILPLDGNPHNAIALIAHPDGVTGLTCSYDGRYVFSSGGIDGCVHMWDVNLGVLEIQAELGGRDLVPFYGLLEGGHDGQLFHELEDYFYYSMLRTQGISTMEVKKTSTTIAVSEIPFVMRALGFYPSEQEIEDMMNEVKYSRYVDTGEYVTSINLAEFIKLYINHRPVFGLEEQKLRWAFETLGISQDDGMSSISREDILDLLQNHGEHLTEYELAEYLTTLLGFTEEGGSSELNEFDPTRVGELLEKNLPTEFNPKSFAEDLLGFQLYKKQTTLSDIPSTSLSNY